MSLSLKDLSKRDLVSILETIDLSRSSHTHSQVKELILKAKDAVEADYAICGICRHPLEKASDIVTVINGNYPSEWLSHYFKEGLYRIDPVIRGVMRFSITRSWSEILRDPQDPEIERLIGGAHDFGIRHGVTAGVYVPEAKGMCVFTFCGGKDVYKERHREIIEALSLHLNAAVLRAASLTGAWTGKAEEKGRLH